MTYAESIEFLYGLRLFGLKLGLENTRTLAGLAGDPHHKLEFIHVAGTNGKGSVSAMLESVYRASGRRVGLYTSPHLVSFRERIQVNRQLISEPDVVRCVRQLRDLSGMGRKSADHAPPIEECTDNPSPPAGERALPSGATFFEFVTVLALQYFTEQQCDLVIWETGLGGRLDATNIVTPVASVITNVDPDHQRWLGHDLKSIANEKAGIIKPGVPVITATSTPEALAVIEEITLERGSALTLVTPEHLSHPPLTDLQLPLPGWHQRMNAATALATFQTLQARLPVAPEAIRSGLETVRWPGRLQLLTTGDGRRILLDAAHNAAAATSLRAVLQEGYRDQPITLILGILQDKDWALMCEVLAPVADRIVCVPVRSERGADPDRLAETCRATHNLCEITVSDSIPLALEQTRNAGLTVVTGSIYLVGEALRLLDAGTDNSPTEQSLNEWASSPTR
jgi:dihydrofolate synthase/folylpolyglutamate synthase